MECTGNCQRNGTGFLFLASGCGCFYCCLVASDDSLHAGVIVCRNNIAFGCCTNFFYFFRFQLHNGTHCTICLLCSSIHCFRTSLDDPKTIFQRQHTSCHHRCIFAQRMPCNGIKCIALFLCCSQAAERSCHDCRLCVNRPGEGFCFAVLNDFFQVKSQYGRGCVINHCQCRMCCQQIQTHARILRTLSRKKRNGHNDKHPFVVNFGKRNKMHKN